MLKNQWFFDILIDNIHSKNKKYMFFIFPFQTKNKATRDTPKKCFESKPHILSKVFFLFCSSSFFWVCLLIHMVAICVRMLAYLTVPGKSNFDQRFSLKSLRTM